MCLCSTDSKLRIILGSGNCGYHVLQGHLAKIDKYKNVSISDIHNKVADTLLTDSDLFASFIPGAQVRVERQGVIDTRRFEAYVRRTRIAGTYTDHPEWVAARRAFPELPPFVFVSPVATSHGPKLVQSFFGDSTTCAATKHLQDNGVTPDTLRALGPDVIRIVIFFTREKGGRFEETEHVAASAPPPLTALPEACTDGTAAAGIRRPKIANFLMLVVRLKQAM